jgi:hypothetical protein
MSHLSYLKESSTQPAQWQWQNQRELVEEVLRLKENQSVAEVDFQRLQMQVEPR